MIRVGAKYQHLAIPNVGCACCAILSRRSLLAGLTMAAAGVALMKTAPAQPAPTPAEPKRGILFSNVKLFNGRIGVPKPTNVLVRGNTIERISPAQAQAGADANVFVIDGGGRTLMPGLIDAHAHVTFNTISMPELIAGDPAYLQIRMATGARDLLMAGFTSVRDAGGPVFGIRRAIEENRLDGPRIWAAGTMVSQTSGHNDFRSLADLPSAGNPGVVAGVRFRYSAVADGEPEVHRVVREQLMQGANLIKLALGGGVSSNFDPVDVTEYTQAEVAAAVADAENWGTYVTVHAYTPRAVRLAVGAGVRCIEYGQLLDEPTIKMLSDRGIWLSTQPFLDDEDGIPTVPGSENERKYKQVAEGTDRAYTAAKKYGVKLAFGTDIQFNPKGAVRQGFYLPKLARWFAPADVLKMATADNGELLAMSGPRNPYPGKLGVVEEGALADLLLVDGDPLSNLKLFEDPGKNLVVIMKNGKIYKDKISG
ncbi:metal-dependent hydrolase family protein [Methylocapsa palsarum]|uniref:Imidazolonepropionase n=1 Tax=Methylocapsa palsarum TaxID=1612308 RepID=A0A1I3Z1B9_9HYPH|nr:amidohydrolase family protein [Methylocapsa palsarum]SFK37854.1 Imidazolonepropionase [Methylocapsa palsarum]